MPSFEYEEKHYLEGYTAVCGLDEAGRGPLCGPVVAAAVILPLGLEIEGLNDSKKLSEKKREALYDEIIRTAKCYSVALVDAQTIDRINIREATKLCMAKAVDGLGVEPDFLLIDGNFVINRISNERFVIGGDALSLSIGAASILAKVTRDRLMKEIHEEFPEYNFLKHKGYGTKEHIEAIKKHGPSVHHRRSFLTRIL